MIWTLVLLGIGFLLLIKGADYLIEGAVAIAKRFGLSELLIGLTIVAFGTSAPELAVSFQAALKGSGIALGNVLGSNIANIALI
ncbi:MAG: sodium:calcium antiporter, partial [Thermotogota bacterium]|nr:sodium:calcium antiporter [Thermotogota bacterium]